MPPKLIWPNLSANGIMHLLQPVSAPYHSSSPSQYLPISSYLPLLPLCHYYSPLSHTATLGRESTATSMGLPMSPLGLPTNPDPQPRCRPPNQSVLYKLLNTNVSTWLHSNKNVHITEYFYCINKNYTTMSYSLSAKIVLFLYFNQRKRHVRTVCFQIVRISFLVLVSVANLFIK